MYSYANNSTSLNIQNKKGVTNRAVHIGGAKVANNVIRERKCHFGATYMDGMTGDPPFYFGFSKGT